MNPNESTAILPRRRLPESAINSDFMHTEKPCTASPLHKALDNEYKARMAVLGAPNSKTAADAYMEAQRNTSRIEEEHTGLSNVEDMVDIFDSVDIYDSLDF